MPPSWIYIVIRTLSPPFQIILEYVTSSDLNIKRHFPSGLRGRDTAYIISAATFGQQKGLAMVSCRAKKVWLTSQSTEVQSSAIP